MGRIYIKEKCVCNINTRHSITFQEISYETQPSGLLNGEWSFLRKQRYSHFRVGHETAQRALGGGGTQSLLARGAAPPSHLRYLL